MFYGAIIAALVPLMTTAFPLEERQTPSTTSALVAVPSQTSQIPNLYDPEGIATVDGIVPTGFFVLGSNGFTVQKLPVPVAYLPVGGGQIFLSDTAKSLGPTIRVLQSSFNEPCSPLDGGFDTGVITESQGISFNVSTPIYFYGGSADDPEAGCRQGFVGGWNLPGPNATVGNFYQFQAAAKAASPTGSSAAPAPTPPPFFTTLTNGTIQEQTAAIQSFDSVHPLTAMTLKVTFAPAPTAEAIAGSAAATSIGSQATPSSSAQNTTRDNGAAHTSGVWTMGLGLVLSSSVAILL